MKFTDSLNKRREALGLSVVDVASMLTAMGISVSYATVARWFNGERGERWKPDELHAVLTVLQSDLGEMIADASYKQPDLSSHLYNAAAREVTSLSDSQQAALLSLLKAFRSENAG